MFGNFINFDCFITAFIFLCYCKNKPVDSTFDVVTVNGSSLVKNVVET